MKHKSAEKKYIDVRFKVKADDISDDGSFEGYGSVFNNVDYGGDIIVPGAFLESINELKASGRLLPALWQHQSACPIGVYPELFEDEKGLRVKGELVLETQAGSEAYALLKKGAISGLSIGYYPVEWTYNNDDNVTTLTKIDLFEISLVTFPMNDVARVDTVKDRFSGGEIPTIREFEKFLRDAGFSQKNATLIAKGGIVTLQRDVEDSAEILEMLKSFSVSNLLK